MRVVLDCNVIVAAARCDGTCRRATMQALSRHVAVFSPLILAEYGDVARRPKHRKARDLMLAMIDVVVATGAPVPDVLSPFPLADPSDEIYLAAAIAGEADCLVTGNRRHFPEPAYGPVRILSPRAFLECGAT